VKLERAGGSGEYRRQLSEPVKIESTGTHERAIPGRAYRKTVGELPNGEST
jgi:hypothetical protein